MSRLKAFSGSSGPSKFNRVVQFNEFLFKYPNPVRAKLHIESLEKDMSLVASGKPGFENRENSTPGRTSWPLWAIRSQSLGSKRLLSITNLLQR